MVQGVNKEANFENYFVMATLTILHKYNCFTFFYYFVFLPNY